ncbi:MAG TPA: SWIB/MDM2 domain-containing protein [Segetibacter sp.]|jgi:chromatin remodeling complex protein RSC6
MAKAAKKAATKKASAAPKKAAAKKASTTSTKAASTGKKAAGKKAAGKKSARKPNAAFMAPLNVSPALAAVIGSKPLPRTEIIKKIWDYIKKNDLQDSKNRRMINADEKLGGIFEGKKQISMFELAKVVNNQVQK